MMKNMMLGMVLIAGVLVSGCTSARFHASYPENHRSFHGLGHAINHSKTNVHVVLVHGMGHGEYEDSKCERLAPWKNPIIPALAKALKRHKDCVPTARVELISAVDVSSNPTVRVNQYKVSMSNGRSVYFHDIIYSLNFARGADEPQTEGVYDKRDLYGHDWQFTRCEAWLNKKIKRSVINWGMADAVMYVGEKGPQIRGGIRQALAFIRNEHRESSDNAIFICSSLGAKIFFDSLLEKDDLAESENSPVRLLAASQNIPEVQAKAVFEQSSEILQSVNTLFLFANQLALLELGNPIMRRVVEGQISQTQSGQQISLIAFSDPGDPLTYQVSPLLGTFESNANNETRPPVVGIDYVVRTRAFLNPFLRYPGYAHTKHYKNPLIMDLIVNGYQ